MFIFFILQPIIIFFIFINLIHNWFKSSEINEFVKFYYLGITCALVSFILKSQIEKLFPVYPSIYLNFITTFTIYAFSSTMVFNFFYRYFFQNNQSINSFTENVLAIFVFLLGFSSLDNILIVTFKTLYISYGQVFNLIPLYICQSIIAGYFFHQIKRNYLIKTIAFNYFLFYCCFGLVQTIYRLCLYYHSNFIYVIIILMIILFVFFEQKNFKDFRKMRNLEYQSFITNSRIKS